MSVCAGTRTRSPLRLCARWTRSARVPGQALGHVHEDHPADPRGRVDLPQAWVELVEEHRRLAPGVLELLPHLPRHVHGVRVDRYGADPHGPVEGDHELRAVRQHERDAVAFAHAELEERGREAQGLLLQLPVGQGGRGEPGVEEEAQGHPVGEAVGRPVERFRKRDLGVGDRARDPLFVVAEPGCFVHGGLRPADATPASHGLSIVWSRLEPPGAGAPGSAAEKPVEEGLWPRAGAALLLWDARHHLLDVAAAAHPGRLAAVAALDSGAHVRVILSRARPEPPAATGRP